MQEGSPLKLPFIAWNNRGTGLQLNESGLFFLERASTCLGGVGGFGGGGGGKCVKIIFYCDF